MGYVKQQAVDGDERQVKSSGFFSEKATVANSAETARFFIC